MTNAPISWPREILTPRNVAYSLRVRNDASLPSISGASVVTATDAGIWSVSFDAIPVVTDDQIRTWRAIEVYLEGRLNRVHVPFIYTNQPFPSGSEGLSGSTVPFSDDASFSDDSEFYVTTINVELTTSASRGAVSLSVTINTASTIESGQYFSINNRVYIVRGVEYLTATTALLDIRPPLRENVVLGEYLNFDNPTATMRLERDDSMDLTLELNKWAFPSVRFIEVTV